MKTTNEKGTTRKNTGSRREKKVTAKDLQTVVNSVSAISDAVAAAVGVGSDASAAAPVISAAAAGAVPAAAASRAVAAGVASVAAVSSGRASTVVSDLMDNADIKVIELRNKIASRWTSPKFELSDDYKTVAAVAAAVPADLRERMINGARLAWLARPENAATVPTVAEVVECINADFAREFRNVCGCSCPAADAVRLYSYSNLSVSTITADSRISDYLITSSLPAGLSASGVVGAVMSVRVLADIKRRFAAARAAARNDFRVSMASSARRALSLGISPAVAARYISFLMVAVSATDSKNAKRLRKNLSGCWASLRTVECDLVAAGCVGGVECDAEMNGETFGGFVFPASLPASAPAKVRKLWAKRVRLLSDIQTLSGLLARC